MKQPKFLREWGIGESRRRFCYRKAFLLPEQLTGQPGVRLGIISDSDRVYLNGILIAEHGDFDSEQPQAYDQIRVVPLPLHLVHPGRVNVLLVDVRNYFPREAGIKQDRVQIGPAAMLFRDLDRELVQQLPLLACYLSVGAYFLFLFLRRRKERENLYFSLFCLGLVVYQLRRTQLKYDLGLDFFPWKKAEYMILFLMAPVWYYFVRAFFDFPESRFGRFYDALAQGANIVCVLGAAFILLSTDVTRWDAFNNVALQSGTWPILIVGTAGIMVQRAWHGNRDAWVMCAAFSVVLLTLVLDILGTRGVLNIPRMLGYGFFVFILAQAVILANRFVRVNERAEDLSVNLEHKVTERTEELRQAGQELRAAYENLRELDQLKTNFFANVSHELRTPLTLLLSPLESVLAGGLGAVSAGQQDFLETALRNGQKLLRQINNLLDFSKIEAGQLSLSYRDLDFAAFVRGLTSAFSSAAETAGLNLVVEAPGEPLPAAFDPEKMEKVVLNVLSNAFKFTERGSVHVSVRADGPWAELRVRDTGIGIPSDRLESIFERFQQVDSSATRRFEGTGIGLALARELALAHGGTLVAEAAQGGAMLCLRFPRERAERTAGAQGLPAEGVPEAGTRRSSTRAAVLAELQGRARATIGDEEGFLSTDIEQTDLKTTSHSGETVLIVEDTHDMRRLLFFLLRPHYNVLTARDGRQGLEKAQATKPDLILSDVMMPEMNGYQLLQAVRADPALADTPVVLLSAKADVGMRVEGLDQGADDYVVKPFHARELLARIRGQLRVRALQRAVTKMRDRLEEVNEKLNGQLQIQVSELMLTEKFRNYLPPQLVASILSREEGSLVRSERKKLTIFFSDIVDFTRITDELEPEALSALLNDYLSEMTRIAREHGAVVDKFVGDAILCHFGAVDSRGEAEDAMACVRMAVAMQLRMRELAAVWIDRGYEEPLQIRCGITTGFAAVGNFGSNERLDYTVIGSQVNLASRVETAAAPGEIRIGHPTWALVNRHFRTESAGDIQPKGFRRSFATYRVLF